jgi:uncharacterized membrane protein
MPLCVAPFIAIFVGIFVFMIGAVAQVMIEKKQGGKQFRNLPFMLIGLISIGMIPIACIISLSLQIGTAVPHPWIKPSILDISGQWTLSKCTAQRFKEQWNNFSDLPSKIDFKYDHTFTVENLPALWALNYNSDDIHVGEYISSGSGKWYMKQVYGRLGDEEWMLYAQFQEINKIASTRLIGFYFDGQLPPYNLAYFENINLVILSRDKLYHQDDLCP